MIVSTVMLLMLLLVFAPIRAKIKVGVDLKQQLIVVIVTTFLGKVFDEKIAVDIDGINCVGTVDAQVYWPNITKGKGVNVLDFLNIDCVMLVRGYNTAQLGVVSFIVERLLHVCAYFVGKTVCNRILFCDSFSVDSNMLELYAVVHFSLFELIISLIKQGVLNGKRTNQ